MILKWLRLNLMNTNCFKIQNYCFFLESNDVKCGFLVLYIRMRSND